MKFIKSWLAATVLAALSGCMSMDEMLASDDPFWHDIGESQGANFAIDAYGANDLQAKLDVIGKMRDQTKLAKVYVAKNAAPEVRKAARAKITEESAFAAMLVASNDAAIQREAMDNIKTDAGRMQAVVVMLDNRQQDKAKAVLWQVKDPQAVADVLKSVLNEAMSIKKKQYVTDYDVKAYERLHAKFVFLAPYSSADSELLAAVNDPLVAETKGKSDDFVDPILFSLGKMQKEKEAAETARKFAEAKEKEGKKLALFASDPEQFKKIYPGEYDAIAQKAAEKAAAEVTAVKKAVEDMFVSNWNSNETKPLTDARAFAAKCGSETTAIEVLAAVTDRLGYFKEECDESFSMYWSDGDADNAKSILKGWASLPYSDLMVKTAAYVADKKMRGGDILLSAVDPAQRAAMSAARDSAKVAAMLKTTQPFAVMEVDQMTDATALKKLVAEHPCTLVRAAAAHKIGASAFKDFAAEHKITEPGNNANVGGLFLGMDVGDAYVILAKTCPEMDYSFENPWRDDSESSSEECNIVVNVKGVEQRVVYSDKMTGKTRKIKLPPEMIVKFFPSGDTVEEIGQTVVKSLGLKMEERLAEVKVGGYTVAQQMVLKYSNISGSFASYATEEKEIDQASIKMLLPDDEMVAEGYKAGVINYTIANQMGAPGTLILCGDKLTRKNAMAKASPTGEETIDGIFGIKFGEEQTGTPVYADVLKNNVYVRSDMIEKVPEIDSDGVTAPWVMVRTKPDSKKAWQVSAVYPVINTSGASQLKKDILACYASLFGCKPTGSFILAKDGKLYVEVGNVRLKDAEGTQDQTLTCVSVTAMEMGKK